MGLLVPVLFSLATGLVVVCMGWPRERAVTSDLLLKLCLSSGYGLGVFSCTFFVWLVLGLPGASLIAMDITVFGLLLLILVWGRRESSRSSIGVLAPAVDPDGIGILASWAFSAALLASLYKSAKLLLANPHGTGWDAFAIWNLHARFLFRGGQYWREGFSALLPWSHPDYPLLLPASVAHFWKYLNTDSAPVSAVIAFVFTFSTVALLVSAL